MGNNARWYQGDTHLRPDGLIHQIFTKADYGDNWRRGTYHMKIDIAAQTVTNFDGSVTSPWPVLMADLDANFLIKSTPSDKTGNIPALAFDAVGRAHVCYNIGGLTGGGANADLTPQTVYHMVSNGASFAAEAIVGTLDHRYESGRLAPGPDGKMGLYYPTEEATRGGDIAYRELAAGAPSTAFSDAEIIGIYDRSRSPFNEVSTVKDAHPDLRVLWCEVAQTSDNADASGHRLFAWGVSWFVRRVKPPLPDAPSSAIAVYDHADVATLFSDTLGTVPAVLDGPVRFIADKSGNGNHLISVGAEPAYLRNEDEGYFLDFGDRVSPTTRFETAANVNFAGSGAYYAAVASRSWMPSTTSKLIFAADQGSGNTRNFAIAMLGPTANITVFNGTTGGTINSTTGDIAYSTDCVLSVEVAASTRKAYRDSAQIGSASAAVTTAANKLRMGNTAAGTGALIGRIYGAILIQGAVTEAERLAADAWLVARIPNRGVM